MSEYLTKLIPEILLKHFPADKILHFSVSFLLIFIFFGVRKFLLKEEWFLRIVAYSFRDVLIIWITKDKDILEANKKGIISGLNNYITKK